MTAGEFRPQTTEKEQVSVKQRCDIREVFGRTATCLNVQQIGDTAENNTQPTWARWRSKFWIVPLWPAAVDVDDEVWSDAIQCHRQRTVTQQHWPVQWYTTVTYFRSVANSVHFTTCIKHQHKLAYSAVSKSIQQYAMRYNARTRAAHSVKIKPDSH